MADSLVLARLFELLGGGVASQLPQCAGAIFHLGTGYDIGTPQPVSEFLVQLMGDGEHPTGWRVSNRTITIPVVIAATNRLTLAAAREVLFQALTADQFDLVWAPDGTDGTRNTIYECFRAKATTIAYSTRLEHQLLCQLSVQFDALPYGRSDTLSYLSFDSPVVGVAAPPSQIVLDDFSSVNSSTNATLWGASVATPYGLQSARWRHASSDFKTPLLYTRTIFDPGTTEDFETTANWTQDNGNTSVARSNAQAHGGSWSLAITCTTAGSLAAESNISLACVPGDEITVTAWVRAGSTGRSVTLSAPCFDGTNTFNGTTLPVATATDSSTGWTQLTGTVTIPAGTTAQIHPRIDITGAALGEVHYVDDVSRVRGSTQDITGLGKLTFWFGLGADSPSAYRAWITGLVHFQVTITDDNGQTLTMGLQQQCRTSMSDIWPYWNRVSVPVPGSGTFDYTSVTAYSIKAWTDVHSYSTGKFLELRHAGFLAGFLATPTAGPRRVASDRGGEYVLYGIEGTAPTPLNLHLQLGFQVLIPSTQTLLLTGQPGTGQTYTAPAENPNWLYGDTVDAEGGTTGTWTGSDGAAANATITASATQAHSGTQSIRITPVTGGTNAEIASFTTANIAPQGVPCAQGDRISIRGWVRAGSTSRSVTFGAEFFNSGGTSIGTVSLSAVADSSSAWTLIQGRVTAPASAAYARMIIIIPAPAAGEFHYVDDLYFSWALQATVINTGAGGAGGSTNPKIATTGGGGGGEIAWETNLDLNPGLGHAYTIGKGGVAVKSGSTAPAGQSTTFAGGNGLGGAGTTITAHGGNGGQNELTSNYVSGTGGSGGSGSANTHHFSGGAGGNGSSPTISGGGNGGAGGGSAGDGGAGGAASGTTAGAAGAAGSLSVPGRQGGPASHFGTPPKGGSPGAGGGGTSSYGSAGHLGGNGGDGQIKMIITTYTARQSFPACIVHKLSDRARLRARAVLNIGAGQDAPDGREYAIDDVDGIPARYEGTYTAFLAASAFHGTGARTLTVTVRQYEAAGGAVSSFSLVQSVTPAGVVNGMVSMGEITMPVKMMPPDNTDSYFTVSVQSGDTLDRFLDLLLIDTSGQLVMINLPGGGYSDYYLDAPNMKQKAGLVLGSNTDRSAAVSVMYPNFIMSGGPLLLTPGDNVFTVYSPTGMPALEGDYWPRWQQERLL